MTGEDQPQEKGERTIANGPVGVSDGRGARTLMLDGRDLEFFSFGRKISLEAHEGEFIGISGREGQGRSSEAYPVTL